MAFDLEVVAWDAWSPGIEGPSAWRAWASGSSSLGGTAAAPELPFLPSMFKRRLGLLDRMALAAGHGALAGASPRRVVLATRRGEIGQQCRISAALAETGEVSPSAFSLSVFNAPASLLSIAEKNPGASCAVHAGEESFAAGLSCCVGMLAADPEPVLLLAADEALPDPYLELGEESGRSFALALLLGPGAEGPGGEGFGFAVAGPAPGLCLEAGPEPEALVFLAWLISGDGPLGLGGRRPLLSLSKPRGRQP